MTVKTSTEPGLRPYGKEKLEGLLLDWSRDSLSRPSAVPSGEEGREGGFEVMSQTWALIVPLPCAGTGYISFDCREPSSSPARVRGQAHLDDLYGLVGVVRRVHCQLRVLVILHQREDAVSRALA